MPDTFRKASAAALFAITIGTIAVMWNPALWAAMFPEVPVFCLASAWLILYMAGKAELRLNRVLIPLTAVVAWPVMQLIVGATVYRWATSVSILYWATSAAVVFIGLQIFSDAGVRRQYLRALVVAGFVIAIMAPLQLYTSGGRIFWMFEVWKSDVAMGPFVYTNQYAAFIELVLPLALTGVFVEKAGWKTFSALAGAVMYSSVFASTSRSGFVLATVEILVVSALAAKRSGIQRRELLATGALFLGMLVVLALAVGPERLIQKMLLKDPFHGRREYAESSLRMIRDKPLLGVGLGNWPTVYPAYATFDNGYFANQAHSDWAQWAAEGGLPFAFLMLYIAAWSFRGALRTVWGIGVAVVFVQCLADFPIQRMGVAVVFFTLIGAIAYPDEPVARVRRTSRA
jgi:O-antigen ligase